MDYDKYESLVAALKPLLTGYAREVIGSSLEPVLHDPELVAAAVEKVNVNFRPPDDPQGASTIGYYIYLPIFPGIEEIPLTGEPCRCGPDQPLCAWHRLMMLLHHELAHIVHDSSKDDLGGDLNKQIVADSIVDGLGLTEPGADDAVRYRLGQADKRRGGLLSATSKIDPVLPMILNMVEDVRINHAMTKSWATRLSDDVRTDTSILLKDYAKSPGDPFADEQPAVQFTFGVFLSALGLTEEEIRQLVTDEEVANAIFDPEIQRLASTWADSPDVVGSLRKAAAMIGEARRRGYYRRLHPPPDDGFPGDGDGEPGDGDGDPSDDGQGLDGQEALEFRSKAVEREHGSTHTSAGDLDHLYRERKKAADQQRKNRDRRAKEIEKTMAQQIKEVRAKAITPEDMAKLGSASAKAKGAAIAAAAAQVSDGETSGSGAAAATNDALAQANQNSPEGQAAREQALANYISFGDNTGDPKADGFPTWGITYGGLGNYEPKVMLPVTVDRRLSYHDRTILTDQGTWPVFPTLAKSPLVMDRDMARAAMNRLLPEFRKALAENQRGHSTRHLKRGKIRGMDLARVPAGFDRPFQKRDKPSRRNYAFVIGLDWSGSTESMDIQLADGSEESRFFAINAIAAAEADLLDALGIPFCIMAHTSCGYGSPIIYVVKRTEEPWGLAQRLRLASMHIETMGNLDGSSLRFYRRVAEGMRATDTFLLYHTDGQMPAECYSDQVQILLEEVDGLPLLSRRKTRRVRVVGVGVGPQGVGEPQKFGMDAFDLGSNFNLTQMVGEVVRQIGRRILDPDAAEFHPRPPVGTARAALLRY